jgi:acyl phosphate:glycerol-3-phosphate acyltransferase
MSLIAKVVSLLIGYGFGLFQTAFIYSKIKGGDIRKVGSGNSGTTNALRSYGKKAGVLVLIGDLFKCIFAILVARVIFAGGDVEMGRLVGLYAGLGVILGHNFPFYMNFKGGKGICSTLGIAIMFWWPLGIVACIIFFSIIAATHYVSVGSLAALSVTCFAAVILSLIGMVPVGQENMAQVVILFLIIIFLGFFQHRGNIKRLATHSERKTYIFKKNKES